MKFILFLILLAPLPREVKETIIEPGFVYNAYNYPLQVVVSVDKGYVQAKSWEYPKATFYPTSINSIKSMLAEVDQKSAIELMRQTTKQQRLDRVNK